MGDTSRLRFKTIAVESANIAASSSATIPNDSQVQYLLSKSASNNSGRPMAQRGTSSGNTTVQPNGPAVSVPNQSSPAATVIAIEVTARTSGKLYFQNKEIATLWDNETHTIPIEGPGTYALKMVFNDHEETRSVAINTRGITKVSFGGAYTVGQTGPAGGIVFFDKSSYSDGWRYLEAAPADIPGTAEWGANNRNLGGTTTGRGAGKRNTQIIADYLRDLGETGRAAQVAREYRQDGYDDWFLPSKDELNLMYQNLKEKSLGRFKNELYWSSSEYGSSYAWLQNFTNGTQNWGAYVGIGMLEKNRGMYVRAIRQF
jgi:hypothetical protein